MSVHLGYAYIICVQFIIYIPHSEYAALCSYPFMDELLVPFLCGKLSFASSVTYIRIYIWQPQARYIIAARVTWVCGFLSLDIRTWRWKCPCPSVLVWVCS